MRKAMGRSENVDKKVEETWGNAGRIRSKETGTVGEGRMEANLRIGHRQGDEIWWEQTDTYREKRCRQVLIMEVRPWYGHGQKMGQGNRQRKRHRQGP